MHLVDAIHTFLYEVAALRDLATNSVRSYRNRLQTFMDFLGDPQIDVAAALAEENVINYFHWLRDQGFKRTTTYSKKQVLVMFLDWAYKKGLIQEKSKIQLKKPRKRKVVYLTPDEATRMERAAIGGTGQFSILHLRDRAAFALLCETHIPIQALTQLSIDDYDSEAHTLTVGSVKILLSDELCQAIDEYLEARKIRQEW